MPSNHNLYVDATLIIANESNLFNILQSNKGDINNKNESRRISAFFALEKQIACTILVTEIKSSLKMKPFI